MSDVLSFVFYDILFHMVSVDYLDYKVTTKKITVIKVR